MAITASRVKIAAGDPPAMRSRPEMYDVVSCSDSGRNSQRRTMRCFSCRSDVSFEPIRQFGLAAQDDVQQFRRGGLDVAEEANLFEQQVRHALRFIDDQPDEPADGEPCLGVCRSSDRNCTFEVVAPALRPNSRARNS